MSNAFKQGSRLMVSGLWLKNKEKTGPLALEPAKRAAADPWNSPKNKKPGFIRAFCLSLQFRVYSSQFKAYPASCSGTLRTRPCLPSSSIPHNTSSCCNPRSAPIHRACARVPATSCRAICRYARGRGRACRSLRRGSWQVSLCRMPASK